MPDAQGLKLVNLITTAIELVANLLLNLIQLPATEPWEPQSQL
jgi:hypothetical protein